MDYAKITENIRGMFRDYIIQNRLQAAVLGVSGGIDSTVCCALARPVCNELEIPLIGRSIPISTNKEDEIQSAKMVGEAFCHDFAEVDLSYVCGVVSTSVCNPTLTDGFKSKIRNGNIKARLRMILLYDLAQANKGIVLSTDNFTELLLGFWTLHGDVGDLGMIQNLWKTEVYELAKHLQTEGKEVEALQVSIDATPTDGLGITNSDLDQLGVATYEEADKILKIWLCDDEDCFAWDHYLRYEGRPEEWEQFKKIRMTYEGHVIVQRHLNSEYKRNNPVNFNRNDVTRGAYKEWNDLKEAVSKVGDI